jgi:large subunit ribosomal protein L47
LKDLNEDVNKKLREFFDDEKNLNEENIKHGRSWTLAELRIKSNIDLHKLWYVLLKERNMLLTMEHEHKAEWKWWPSPERLDKVKESMVNLETVVRERNKAYFELETGSTGEVPGKFENNVLGLQEYRKFREYTVPKYKNRKWETNNPRFTGGRAARKFLQLYREKLINEKRKAKNRDRNHLIRLIRRNPNINMSFLSEKYPHIDVMSLKKKDKFRGHYVPKID